jgi:hypothetical protein
MFKVDLQARWIVAPFRTDGAVTATERTWIGMLSVIHEEDADRRDPVDEGC